MLGSHDRVALTGSVIHLLVQKTMRDDVVWTSPENKDDDSSRSMDRLSPIASFWLTLFVVFVGLTLPIALCIEIYVPLETENPCPSIQEPTIVKYELQETGKISSGAVFQKFQAVEIARLRNESRVITIAEWTRELLTSDDALETFLEVLRSSPFDGFYFETRPVDHGSLYRKEMQFVLVDAPELYRFAMTRASPRKFQEPFATCTSVSQSDTEMTVPQAEATRLACAFTSRHGGTTLISPLPPRHEDGNDDTHALAHHSHLAEFCRRADPRVVTHTWRLALQTYHEKTADDAATTWFSTAGLEAPWLHFRVEHRPRYYSYGPFRDED